MSYVVRNLWSQSDINIAAAWDLRRMIDRQAKILAAHTVSILVDKENDTSTQLAKEPGGRNGSPEEPKARRIFRKRLGVLHN